MEKWITEEQEGRTSRIPWVQTDAENQKTANKIFIVLEACEEMLDDDTSYSYVLVRHRAAVGSGRIYALGHALPGVKKFPDVYTAGP